MAAITARVLFSDIKSGGTSEGGEIRLEISGHFADAFGVLEEGDGDD